MDKNVKMFIEKLKEMPDFDRVRFVFLFGSQANNKANKMSDYDFAVYYEGSKKERFNFRIRMSPDEKFDVHIFQDLPLYIRSEVLKGEIIYVKKDFEEFAYDAVYETIKAFDMFKKYYYDYLERRSLAA